MYLQMVFKGLKDNFATRRKITKFDQNIRRIIIVTTNVNPTVPRAVFILRFTCLLKFLFSVFLLLASCNKCKVV